MQAKADLHTLILWASDCANADEKILYLNGGRSDGGDPVGREVLGVAGNLCGRAQASKLDGLFQERGDAFKKSFLRVAVEGVLASGFASDALAMREGFDAQGKRTVESGSFVAFSYDEAAKNVVVRTSFFMAAALAGATKERVAALQSLTNVKLEERLTRLQRVEQADPVFQPLLKAGQPMGVLQSENKLTQTFLHARPLDFTLVRMTQAAKEIGGTTRVEISEMPHDFAAIQPETLAVLSQAAGRKRGFAQNVRQVTFVTAAPL